MRALFAGLLGLASLAAVGSAAAASVVFDFTTLGSNNTALANSVTVNGVTAEGLNADNLSVTYNLWLRKQTNDNGLGVCSEGTPACTSNGGDVNELDNANVREAIRLTRPENAYWTSLYVSSLDSGGTGGSEEGRLLWSNTADFSTVLGSASFAYPAFSGSAVEGNILPSILAQAGDVQALISAKYLLFTHPAGSGDNNDYLVWKGAYDVPEPATLGLLGIGLLGLGLSRSARRGA